MMKDIYLRITIPGGKRVNAGVLFSTLGNLIAKREFEGGDYDLVITPGGRIYIDDEIAYDPAYGREHKGEGEANE